MSKIEAYSLNIKWSMALGIKTVNENAVKIASNPVRDEVFLMGHIQHPVFTSTQWITLMYLNAENGN